MQAGLHLSNAQGETLEVVSQIALEQTGTVYNIEVHEHSTYHVGEMGVWVRNSKCCTVGRTADTKEPINFAVALRNYLSEQEGIPTSTENIWGASLNDLKQALDTGGVIIFDKPAKLANARNAQIFKVQGSSTGIVEVQFSPQSDISSHKGQYYKFTYDDGSQLKIIDPNTYKI